MFGTEFACTIGAFSKCATTSQKPILWKNRDVSNPDQAVFFFPDTPYQYLGLVYAGDSTRVWAGINEKGFAIINSNSANIGPGADSGPDDGAIMKYALKTCTSIQEFAYFLDSTNHTGRRVPANFGVFDSTGEATIFEAGGYQYQRFDASKESLGFILRANYSMSGDTTQRTGHRRYLRGMELVQKGYEQGVLDAQYIIQRVSRDIGGPGFDPYPLPFQDTFGSYPFGFLPTTASINRYRTRACVVIVGAKMMWTILGEPCVGIALPLFLAAKAVPNLVSGPGVPKICDWAKRMRARIYVGTDLGINTFLLAEIYQKFLPCETELFAITENRLNHWQNQLPASSEILAFEDSLAQRIVEVYESFDQDFPKIDLISYPIVNVTPNPAHQQLRISIKSKVKIEKFKIYNTLGQKVAEIAIPPDAESVYWLPKQLGFGVYFLKAHPNHQILTKFSYLRK